MSVAADKERANFSERLRKALADIGWRPSAAMLADYFNRRGGGVTVTKHSTEKWLNGGAIPTRDKIRVLADALCVSMDWLAYGKETVDSGRQLCRTSRQEEVLLREYRALKPEAKRAVRSLVSMLSTDNK